MQRKRILKTDITHASYTDVLERIIELGSGRTSSYVCISNVHMLIEAYRDDEINRIVNGSAIATPDGMPLSIFMNLIYGTRQERIAGPDLMIDLFRYAEKEELSIYFYGSTSGVLDSLWQKLGQEYPRIKVAGMFSPPFRKLTEEELDEHAAQINESGANIVLVSLGCPKQERWMARQQGRVRAVMVGVGAAFPFYTGQVNRAPLWMQKFALEWLHRLCSEPGRLFGRYFSTNSLFLILITKQLLQYKTGLKPGRGA